MYIILNYISHASVIFAILGFIYTSGRLLKKKREIKLESLLLGAFSGSTIPTGFVLIWGAFDIEVILKLQDGLNVHIAAAGLALLYISFSSLHSS